MGPIWGQQGAGGSHIGPINFAIWDNMAMVSAPICMNPKVGFESPSGWDIFCLKNFDTFTRTPVRVSKINAISRAQLTFQMLTLLQKYLSYCETIDVLQADAAYHFVLLIIFLYIFPLRTHIFSKLSKNLCHMLSFMWPKIFTFLFMQNFLER